MLSYMKKLVVTGTTRHDVLANAGLFNTRIGYKSVRGAYIPIVDKDKYYGFVNFEKRNAKVRVSHHYDQNSHKLIKQRDLIHPPHWVGYVYFFDKNQLDNQYGIEIFQGNRTFKFVYKIPMSLRTFNKLQKL